jgi:CRP-like cAMP-binding protein
VPFQAVPFRDRLLNRLIKRAHPLEVGRGERLFAMGDEAEHVVLVREGLLRLEEGADGEGRVVDVVLPWELAGVESILRGGRHRWTAVAERRCVVQLLEGKAVRRVLKRAEGTFDAFLEAYLGRLALVRELGPGGRGTTARQRLARVLVHLASRSEGESTGSALHGPDDRDRPLELSLDLTHRVLGQLAGLHRSTVTTVLNDWIYEDLIEDTPTGWRIPDPGALLGSGSH